MSAHHHRDRITARWTREQCAYEIYPTNTADEGILAAVGPTAVRTVPISLTQAEVMAWITWDDATRTLMAERWFRGDLSLPS